MQQAFKLLSLAGLVLSTTLSLALVACHSRELGPSDISAPARETDRFYSIHPDQTEGLPSFSVFNAYGEVVLAPSEDASIHVRVQYLDKREAGWEQLTGDQRERSLWVVEARDEVGERDAELPFTVQESGGQSHSIRRLHREVQGIRVSVAVPYGAQINVLGATDVSLQNVQAQVNVRASGEVQARGGEGMLRVESAKLQMRSSNYEVRATCSDSIVLSGVSGDKLLQGDADVSLHGGYGFLRVDVAGDVMLNAPLSPGGTRTQSNGGEHSQALVPSGPRAPSKPKSPDRISDESPINLVQGAHVSVRLPLSSKLDVELSAESGGVEWGISKGAEAKLGDGSARLDVKESSESRVRFSLNTPTHGELKVQAREGVSLLLEEEQ